MGLPQTPVTLTPEQVAELNAKLSKARHDINNQLALIVAAVELIRHKPDMAQRMVDTIAQQPERIVAEMRKLSDAIEKTLGIERD